MKLLLVQGAGIVILCLGSYYIGTLHGAEKPEKMLAALERETTLANRRVERATRTIDNLITELLHKPIPEAPRVKEVIKYVKSKEPATRECLADDTVRMLNSIRGSGQSRSDDQPAGAGTDPRSQTDRTGFAFWYVEQGNGDLGSGSDRAGPAVAPKIPGTR